MKNKHQMNLYLGLKKMANILQITFSNRFSLKKMFWLKFHKRFLAATKQLYEWFSLPACLPACLPVTAFYPFSSGWRGIVITVGAGGQAGGCQICGTHISVTAWWIFSIRSSVELSRPVVVHCHGHLPICPIWACPWAKNLSNLSQIGSRLCGMHISETAGWIYPI